MGTDAAVDDELLAGFAAGDVDAFGVFYRRHLGAMLAFFLRRTGDRELAADLAAEVFAAALDAGRRYRPGERPALAWLYGIAAHKLIHSRRRGVVESKARRRLSLEPLVIDDSDLARIEELAGSDAERERVEGAVRSLPGMQRDAVLARVVQERDYSEIAQRMVCSELVVRQRVSRGLRSLRDRLEETP